jgi:hypothetical protein
MARAKPETSYEPFPPMLSLPCRLFNRFGQRLALRIGLGVEELMRKACEITGLSDWGEMDFLEPLRVLNGSYEEDAQLSATGRWMVRKAQLQRLITRLRIQRDFTLHPDLAQVVLPPALFITGLPRTGTTLLHRLFAQDPDFRTLRAWELMIPSPPPDRATYDHDPRRRLIERSRRIRQRFILSTQGWQQIQAVHPTNDDDPEECWLLLQNSFRTSAFFLFDRVNGYASWLSKQGFEPAYQYYQKQLQLLTLRYSGTHLVLKAPEHLFHLNALFQVFPDARVIMTHRNLSEVIPSICHLFGVFRQIKNDQVDPKEIGTVTLDWILNLMKRGVAARTRINPERFFDIAFARLMRDPMGVVREVYQFIGKGLSEEAESRMKVWLSQNHPYPQRGPWKPFFPRYGLTEETIRTRLTELEDYADRFSQYLK